MARLLRRLGPTWRATPVRRAIQGVCLCLYLGLFFLASWPYAKLLSHGASSSREWLPAQTFLWLDPLVGLCAGLAARCWNPALLGAILVLAACLVLPRVFCGWLCPFGTLIDLFDALIGRRFRRFHLRGPGRWAALRYYLLAIVIASACFGVVLAGFVAAIPVLTRGLLFTAGHLQLGLMKNWGMVPAVGPAILVSIALFAGVFLLGLLGPRFWCRCLCPTGALLSLPGLCRFSRRKVSDRCNRCGKCAGLCSFDAIHSDFSTRVLHCAFCQTCAGVCPRRAISFELGPSTPAGKDAGAPSGGSDGMCLSSGAYPVSRRALVASAIAGAATVLVPRGSPAAAARPLRPPGSVSEGQFLDLCLRCEQCLKVCPGPVLQAAGLEHGWEALWTPVPVFTHAGCHQDCNFCAQVCPTGAIRPLSLEAKRRARIGLAVIDPALCLPHRGTQDCQLCFAECNAAGYRAIEMRRVALPVGQIPEGTFSPAEIEEMSSISAPFVRADACVGCGLCEYRCHSVNRRQRKLLPRSAIVVRVTALAGLAALSLGAGETRPLRDEAWSGRTMGSSYSIKIAHAHLSDAGLAQLKVEVDDALKEVNRQMSHFQPDSELSRFNARESLAPFPVSPGFATVARFSLELYRRSEGAFDPTLGPLVNAWGFGQKGEVLQPPGDDVVAAARELCGCRHLSVTPGGELRKAIPRLQLNLSAVAAGFAADEAARVIRAHGITNLFAEIAGEIFAQGFNARGRPWRVGIESPDPGQAPGTSLAVVIPLANAGLATSGNYRKFYRDAQGRVYSHILNPATGRPVEHPWMSVTAIAPDGLTADGLSTALFVMGPEAGLRWIETQTNASALFLVREPDGRLRQFISSRFPKPVDF